MKRLMILFLLLVLASPTWAFEEFEGKILQDAAGATADGVPLVVSKYNTVGVQLTISASATVTWEGSTLGVWSAIPCTNKATGTAATTATGTGLYVCDIAGLTTFRARVSTFGSGTVTAFAKATTATLSSGAAGGGGGGDASEAKQDAQIVQETAIAGGVGTAADGAATPGSTGTLNAKERLMTTQLDAISARLSRVVTPTTLASGVTTNTTSAAVAAYPGYKTIRAQVAGTGVVTATITFYCDNDNDATAGNPIGEITLSGTTLAHDVLSPFVMACAYIYQTTSNVTGTGATESAVISY